MARTRVAKLAFNRGLVSRLGLARADIKRVAMAAETQTNWMTRVLGSMSLRAGWGYLGNSKNDAAARHLNFVFSVSDKAVIELTDLTMRVWITDALVTRVSVASAVANGGFDANLGSWTNNDEVGGTSAWVTGGYLGLTGDGSAAAIRTQQVTVAVADQGKEHALKILIERGPITLRVGSTSGGDEYINETSLMTGSHSLAFTPTGDFYIRFLSRLKRQGLVNSCNVDAAGTMEVAAPWLAADLGKVRFDQSADVLFVACEGYQQRRIERRATRSWSIVTYQPSDGPFRIENVGPNTLTPSALSGNITLTASSALFRSTQVGALFQLTSSGQTVATSISAQNTFTNAIRVTGVGATRGFGVVVSGTWVGTVRLQSSTISATGPWTDTTWSTSANATFTFTDGLDNQIVWYRIGIKTAEYTSGTAACQLTFSQGSIKGTARITAYTSSTIVSAEVLVELGGSAATSFWAEGAWSDYRGWPTSVGFVEGRLGWAGKNGIWLSVSDAFDSFDENTEGDSGPIVRTIGSGPVDTINWMLPLQRLVLGGQDAEFSVRSSSLDEPLTPTNFNIKAASTQGSAAVQAVKIDQHGVYVQRGGTRVYELAFGAYMIDYESTHLSALIPEIGQPGIVRIAVQRQPDTRVHFVRSDGNVALLVFDKLEQVICWKKLDTDGLVEDVVVLPGNAGQEEDWVYYSVKRTINGVIKRSLEKWAFESECRGGTQNKQADAFVTYNQAASATISGLSHLEAKSVVVWDNGKCLRDAAGDIATFTVTAGSITVSNAGVAYQATLGVVGLQYTASWKSAKLVELMQQLDSSLTDRQILKSIGLILADVHAKGLKYGQSLTEANMRDLPLVEATGPVDPDAMRVDYATEQLAFPGEWSTDARLCLLAKAPRPCTVLAAIAELEHHG